MAAAGMAAGEETGWKATALVSKAARQRRRDQIRTSRLLR
jgi:hypothetical protein